MEATMTDQRLAEILRSFPVFEKAGDDVIDDMVRQSVRKRVPEGFMVCMAGAESRYFPFVLSGRARVFSTGENGREITLYRLCPGDGCVLAVSSIMSDQPAPAFSVVEASGDVLLVPAQVFKQWFSRYDFWRDYVFSILANRLANVIAITNATTFGRLDARVAGYLLDATSGERPEVKTTHQAIATEIGSSREVVSRVLKSFEIEGILRLGRGTIRLSDFDALTARAQPAM